MNEILTQDIKMKELIQLARTVAQSKATILLQGESGTGKELIANLIHESSARAGRTFVAINCAAIPENLLESELFGYERGAFTGAVSSKAGKFEMANGGTLLLDEISEMDIRLQAKLLRVIQEGEVDRLGGRKPIPVDVRIIATTNCNLSECVKEGSFREDLFYRLNVVTLSVPALRERTGDVTYLAEHFARNYAQKNSRSFQGISPEAFSMLESHSWNGNVRELENVIERAILTSVGGRIEAKDVGIQASMSFGSHSSNGVQQAVNPSANPMVPFDLSSWKPGTTLDQIEKNVIIDALKFHKGNRTHTAKALGISIRTLRNKLADYRRDGIYV